MRISKFAKKHNTTVDTVKYYIKLELLTPEKENNWYVFTDKDKQDFENIICLKQIGLSLDVIKEIKRSHDLHCGSKKQWETNLAIINGEIERVRIERELLDNQEKMLIEIKKELNQKLLEK